MKKYLFFVLIILFLVVPFIVFAAEWKWGDPLVICGREGTNPCTLCDIFRLAKIIVQFITTGLFVIAPIFIVMGGIRILIGGAKPDEVQSGKKMITNAIIGIVIALLAWVVLNMIFNELAKPPGQAGIPWPWNKITCVGGGVVESTTLTYCHIQYRNQNDVMAQKYENNTACSQGCAKRCSDLKDLCEDWCCLDRDLNGKDDVCKPVSEQQWCKRTPPSGSDKWILTSYIQNPNGQKGDASTALTDFLNCIYKKISNLQINAISSNDICNRPTCNPAKENCGHAINSCHFGGTRCKGSSWAVDFNINVTCSNIADAAKACDSSAWILWESDHTHVSISGRTCGCAESQGTSIECKGH